MKDDPTGLPYDVDAERNVLGSILRDGALVHESGLRASDLYLEQHRHALTAMQAVAEAGDTIDLVTVGDAMGRWLEPSGGPMFLANLLADRMHTVGFAQHCRIVRDHATNRAIIRAATDIASKGYEVGIEAREYQRWSEQRLLDAAQDRNVGGYADIRDVAVRVLEEAEACMVAGSVPATPTGMKELDKLLRDGGLPPKVTIAAARPGLGKTAWGVQVAERVARRCAQEDDGCVLVHSVEMSNESMVQRWLRGAADRDLDYGQLDGSGLSAWSKAAAEMPAGRLYLCDGNVSAGEVVGMVRRHHRRQRVKMVLVDYLQLMRPDLRRVPREQQVSDASRRLVQLSKEIAAPVVVLSQLNRGVEGRTDKRPMLSDLRESGSLEQDAAVVLFLYRDGYYDKTGKADNSAEVIVSKQRDGQTGTARMLWNGRRTRFEAFGEGEYTEGKREVKTW